MQRTSIRSRVRIDSDRLTAGALWRVLQEQARISGAVGCCLVGVRDFAVSKSMRGGLWVLLESATAEGLNEDFDPGAFWDRHGIEARRIAAGGLDEIDGECA